MAKKRKLSFDEQISPGGIVKKSKPTPVRKPMPPKRTPLKKIKDDSSTPKKVILNECPKIDDHQCLYPKRLVPYDPKGVTIPAELDYRLRNFDSAKPASKFGPLIHIEVSIDGQGSVIHAYQDEINTLSEADRQEFVDEFLRLTFEETNGRANHVMSVVHGAAAPFPDLLEYMAIKHPELTIKKGIMGKSDIETMPMLEYRNMVHATYDAGTFRAGPLHQVSIVGTKAEEVGDYFPELLDILEADPFLKATIPWGSLSIIHGMQRNLSNDGPILWARPGEQVIPTADMPKSPFKTTQVGVKI